MLHDKALVSISVKGFYSKRPKHKERKMTGKSLKQLLYLPHLLPRKPHPAHHLSLILLHHTRRRQQQKCQLKIQAPIGQWKPTLSQLLLLPQANFLFNRKRFPNPTMQFSQSFLLWRGECQRRMASKPGHQD